ncbi:hypothetical protein [Streptomyces sp. NPDC004284]|uniref:hypothetical protein n=1 Tax=Streptomyces sp. NPDC004284 TaxID=3364695 RepID=UPI003686BC51
MRHRPATLAAVAALPRHQGMDPAAIMRTSRDTAADPGKFLEPASGTPTRRRP